MIELSKKIPVESKNNKNILALGLVVVALMALSLMPMTKPARADITSLTFTVNSTADPGSGGCNSTGCTLREAIALANRVEGADTIRFNIPGGGVRTISPTSNLPTITDAVTIDGYTQPNASPNTLAKGTNANLLIELDGTNAEEFGKATRGLTIEASDVVVRGLVINRYPDTGIRIFSSDDLTDNNRIEGNFIGTDPSGTQALSAGFGVDVLSGENNFVGSTSPEARNLISGNDADGVFIGFDAPGTKVLGNLIGTKKDGTTPLGNSNEGVDMLDAERTVVGGTTPGAANTIAFNGDDGVLVSGFSSSGNRILSNSIFANGGLGIDLSEDSDSGDGPTPNDAGDVDEGANGLQNKPAVASAVTSGGKTTIKGKLSTKPSQSYVVKLFSNASGNEGKKFIGQKRVTTNSEGTVSFTFSPARKVGVGKTVTATATGSEGTSEFSASLTVVSA